MAKLVRNQESRPDLSSACQNHLVKSVLTRCTAGGPAGRLARWATQLARPASWPRWWAEPAGRDGQRWLSLAGLAGAAAQKKEVFGPWGPFLYKLRMFIKIRILENW